MRIGISITNHNQHKSVRKTITALNKQTVKQDVIFVCSDDKPFTTKNEKVICINNETLKGPLPK